MCHFVISSYLIGHLFFAACHDALHCRRANISGGGGDTDGRCSLRRFSTPCASSRGFVLEAVCPQIAENDTDGIFFFCFFLIGKDEF
jgi:hypothetical protein